jgi:putative ABC transport system permease protein
VAVTNIAQVYRDGAQDELALIPLMLSLNGILIALAVTNMMIALLFAVRERTREFGIMKTVGFSPGQIVFTVVAGAVVIALIAVVIGTPVGYYLTRLWMDAADTEGLPRDLVQVPSLARMALMVPLAAGLAALGSAFPARRAAGITVNEALRLE